MSNDTVYYDRLKMRLDQSEGYIYDRCLWEDYILGLEEDDVNS